MGKVTQREALSGERGGGGEGGRDGRRGEGGTTTAAGDDQLCEEMKKLTNYV